jgi:hypothetical protein
MYRGRLRRSRTSRSAFGRKYRRSRKERRIKYLVSNAHRSGKGLSKSNGVRSAERERERIGTKPRGP